MEREKLGSRLGFILLSAGCAIGIGNVWRFPYVAGRYGGGAFVLFYLFFLVVMGLPIMTMEFAVGRASKKSIIKSFQQLEKPGTKWHFHGYVGMAGNYCLMMFYTTVAGWMLYYFYLMLTGRFVGADAAVVGQIFRGMLAKPGVMAGLMFLVVAVGFGICSAGLQSGVERITKVMMVALLGIMVLLAAHSLTMRGGMEGIAFYLKPDFGRMMEVGIGETMVGAMNQAFFTLSLGIAAMEVFGSYMKRDHTLTSEAVRICSLDTFVALMAGLIIFPACFAFGVAPDSGPGLVFITLPEIFAQMGGTRIWSSLFFLLLTVAAFTSTISLAEVSVAFMEKRADMSRAKAVLTVTLPLLILSPICSLSVGPWSEYTICGLTIFDFLDTVTTNIMLPVGGILLCIYMGWVAPKSFFRREITNNGALRSRALSIIYFIVRWIAPILIAIILMWQLLRG